MGRRRKGREVNGILLLDKPSGVTSNQALQQVKRIFFARKAGHTGSLDPLASGLLPLCFGHATKISGYLLDATKQYDVTAKFGERTDTGDADGTVVETTDTPPALDELTSVLCSFVGRSQQVPPMYSALKHKGQRLHALARQGKVVERPPREITIERLDCEAADRHSLRFVVSCSKGTYVRTLVEDIAAKLGTVAHVTALRRIGAGPYDAGDLVTMDDIESCAKDGHAALDRLLRPLDTALPDWPKVDCDPDTGFYLLNGQAVQVPNAPASGAVRLYQEGTGLIGLGEILPDGRVAPKRLFR